MKYFSNLKNNYDYKSSSSLTKSIINGLTEAFKFIEFFKSNDKKSQIINYPSNANQIISPNELLILIDAAKRASAKIRPCSTS